MILSDKDITENLNTGKIIIDPFRPEQINPNSYDICLGHWSVIIEGYDSKGNPWYGPLCSLNAGETLLIPEGLPILVSTLEFFGTSASSNLAAMIRAKSSTERKGIIVSPGAGFGDVGFINNWTVFIYSPRGNPGLVVGEPFAQAAFLKVTESDRPYSGQYANVEVPYSMIPEAYRSGYRFIDYGDNNHVTIRRLRYDEEEESRRNTIRQAA